MLQNIFHRNILYDIPLRIITAFLLLCISFNASARINTTETPSYAISTDITLNSLFMPTIGFEKFKSTKKGLSSWLISLSYQIPKEGAEFVLKQWHGDKLSIFTNEGPALRLAYSIHNSRGKELAKPFPMRELPYFSVGCALKYLWYNNMQYSGDGIQYDVFYNKRQSEKSITFAPFLNLGIKRIHGKHILANMYAGIQLPVRYRTTIVTFDKSYNMPRPLPTVPYTTSQVTFFPWFNLGVNVGYIW